MSVSFVRLMSFLTIASRFQLNLKSWKEMALGKSRKCRLGGATANVFFKLPAAMIDDEVGPHQSFLKLAEISVETYETFFRDMSKMTSDVKRLCQQHPWSDYLLAEGLL